MTWDGEPELDFTEIAERYVSIFEKLSERDQEV